MRISFEIFEKLFCKASLEGKALQLIEHYATPRVLNHKLVATHL